MRKSFRWTLRRHTRLQLLCACCALWGAPALAAPADGVLSDRRVILAIASLIAVGGIVGMIAGRDNRAARGPRLRLLNEPKKTQLSVLVPPGPAPRLIPSDSPNAVRPRPTRGPIPRATPDGTTSSGIVDYLAAFADPPQPSEKDRVDFLLVPDDSVDELTGAVDLSDAESSPTRSSDC
jgi:hypothetical protein